MLNCCKFTDTLADTLHRNACTICHCHCRHHILKIVLSKKLKFTCMYKRNFFTFQLKYDQISIQINSLVKLPYTGKINRFRNNILTKFTQYRILIIQNAEILRFLIFDDQFLDADIFLHCMVTVQMILCDVKDRTDLWCKLLNRLKLKAADLCHCCRIFFHFQCFGCIRCSDISYHKN